jgi:hypothetical protein
MLERPLLETASRYSAVNHVRIGTCVPSRGVPNARPTHLFEVLPARIISRKLFEKGQNRRAETYHECQ